MSMSPALIHSSIRSDQSKQFIIDLTITLPCLFLFLPRLGSHRLALAHGLALPRKDIRWRDVRFIIQPTLDVKRHVYRCGCS